MAPMCVAGPSCLLRLQNVARSEEYEACSEGILVFFNVFKAQAAATWVVSTLCGWLALERILKVDEELVTTLRPSLCLARCWNSNGDCFILTIHQFVYYRATSITTHIMQHDKSKLSKGSSGDIIEGVVARNAFGLIRRYCKDVWVIDLVGVGAPSKGGGSRLY